MRLTLFLFLLPTILLAQFEISGTVLDANTGNPLPYVNVFLEKEQSVGVLTNERGEYRLSLTEAQLQDHLVFSLLSFQNHREPLWRLDTSTLFFNLSMETSFVKLEEVIVISDLGLRKVVQRAIDAIPENYARDGHLLKAYARRYDVDNDTFSLYTEALINLRENPRKKNSDPWEVAAKIEQYRSQVTEVETLRKVWKIMNLQGRLLAGYRGLMNFGRRGKFGVLVLPKDSRFTDVMNFSNRGEYLDGQDTLIRIAYRLDTSAADLGFYDVRTIDAWFSGEFLINKTDRAILHYARGNEGATSFDEIVFEKYRGKYYPKRLSTTLQFEYQQGTRTYFTHNDLFITQVITDPRGIRKNYRGFTMALGEPMDDIRVKYNLDFWAKSEFLVQLSAPEEMRFQLEKMQRFLENTAGKMKRDSTK
jgi:hypothetical protein